MQRVGPKNSFRILGTSILTNVSSQTLFDFLHLKNKLSLLRRDRIYAEGRSRTYEGTKPQNLESCPFDHSGTSAIDF